MATKYFNFNNEADQVELEVNEQGNVRILNTEFESVQEFAEFYALNRDVKNENLKNWVLLEDGDRISFVLRAGTAGNKTDDLVDYINRLREAGLSSEEIGHAVYAYTQDVGPENPTPAFPNISEVSEREELLQDYLDSTENAEELLKLSMGQNLAYHLEHADLEEYEDYNYYEQDFTLEELVEQYLDQKLSEAHKLISEMYPHLPLTFAVALYTGNLTGFGTKEENVEEIVKRYVASALASRPKQEVLVVTHIEREFYNIEPRLMTVVELFENNAYDSYFYVENKIIVM